MNFLITSKRLRRWLLLFLMIVSVGGTRLSAVSAATLTFGTSVPAPTTDTISTFVGATFDADNIGGSGVNANGGSNNGAANDDSTYVAANRPAQGQTFTTGSNPGGYTLSSITVRMQGYTNNLATGANIGTYGLSSTSSTFRLRVGRISGTTFIPYTIEYATSGGTGTPGRGGTANGPGTYLTIALKAPIVLDPNTVYAFDLGTTGDYFEMLGIRDAASGGNPYTQGTAYTSGSAGSGGGSITPQAGDRVFQVNLTAYTPPEPGIFVHPGLLSTDADFERMRTKVAMGIEPWASAYKALNTSWMAQSGGWPPHAQATITRSGSTNDTVHLYNDIAVAYASALRWKVSGDTAYADQAVKILNAWGYTFTSIQGDTNVELCQLYGYQLACVAEIMRTYSGWAPADITQFQTMIYNVFYPEANNFIQGHNGTGFSHYWANWDLCAMDSIYAIGVFCDNPTLTSQAVNYFKGGVGNGCIERTVNYIHPGCLGQVQETGRDQGHNTLDIASLATLCQMAWNQGVDLFGYENNRVLAGAEYVAKYNLGNDVPFAPYANSDGWLMTSPSSAARGANLRPGWDTLYNHYVNLMGLAAPYTKAFADQMRPGWYYNGDSPGWDALTASLDPIAKGANPNGLTAIVTAGQPILSWWGSAYATGYNVKRAIAGGPYTTVATGLRTNTYTDTDVVPDTTYDYIVTAALPDGSETGHSNTASAFVGTSLYAQLKFDETGGAIAADATGNGWNGTLVNAPTRTAGKIGGAVSLASGSKQYVTLPGGVVSGLSDFSVSTWVYLNSASTQARIFDFGDGDGLWGGVDPWGHQVWLSERYMFLTVQGGATGHVHFGISNSTNSGEQGVDGAAALPTGQWVHVAITMSGSTASIYVNGVLAGQNTGIYFSPFRLGATTQNYIGKSQWRNDPYLNGVVDDFRIYRGALNASQIAALSSPAPTTTALSPASAVAGSKSFQLTVTGSNFKSSSSVLWNGAALPTTFASDTQLMATVPATAVTVPNIAAVTVTNPAPGGGTSTSMPFLTGLPSLKYTRAIVTRSGSDVTATVTLSNAGSVDAPAVNVTSASLILGGKTLVAVGLPVSAGAIPVGGAGVVVLKFVGVGPLAGAAAVRLSGTFAAVGTFSASGLATVPH